MMQPQDIHMRKMMELLEELHLPEKEAVTIQDYLAGEETEKALEKLSFRDLSGEPETVKDKFRVTFRTLVNRGRTEDARKLFAAVFAVGRSTMNSLFPSDVLTYNNNGTDIIPADQAVSLLAEMVGGNMHWIRTHMFERLKKLSRDDTANVRKAIGHHRSSPDNGLLILYTLYFWMQYPDARYQKEQAAGGDRAGVSLLQSMSKLFASGYRTPAPLVAESDRKMLADYEDLIVESLENLFLHGIARESLNLITGAINHGKITDAARGAAKAHQVSNFLMKLLCGCAFANFALSARLKNVVTICIAANEKSALAAMEEMDVRYDLKGRGGSFDREFGIDPEIYIEWAASKKLKRLLTDQLTAHQDIFLRCYKKAGLGAATYMLEIIREQNRLLYEELIHSGREMRMKQILEVVFPDQGPAHADVVEYLMGRSSVADLYPLEDKLAGRSHYAGSREYEALKQYEGAYGRDNFYNRCLIILIFREAAYVFHHLLVDRGEVKRAEVTAVYHILDKEKLDVAHQLKTYSLMSDVLFSERWKSVLTEETEKIFGAYLQERGEKTLAAFRQADVYGRCFALGILDRGGEEYRQEILSYSKDSSKQVRERLLEILRGHREWEEDVLTLLASRKAGERELAIRILLSWDEKDHQQTLKEAWEKEKNGKVRALLDVLFAEGQGGGAEEISRTDIVKALHKGGKKRTLAWAYTTPFSAVRQKDGQNAEEEYLQAILLCYSSMDKPGVSREAKELAGALEEADLAVYMGELFDKWMEAGAEAKKRWVLYAASIHGGSDIIRKLQHQIQEWPAHSRGAIAADAVYALALNPRPQALLIVDGIARKFKFRQVKAAAGKALEFAASQLGLSREELSDKIVPDLGFDENMQRFFDYGDRRFTVTITPSLEIEICDENKKKLKNMPSPGKRDDQEKAKAAYDAFKEMKKQMKATVASQKARLELALSVGREWEIAAWNELFVQNPIMHQFAIGLIWGIYENHILKNSFRYMEDGSFNTEEEEEFTLPESGRIGLVHPIELDDVSRAAWREQLEDYEIVQPVEQLTRSVYYRTGEEAAGRSLERFGGILINDLSLGGKLQAMGWYRGSVQDGGGFYTYYREDTENGMGVELHFSGSYVGGSNEDITVYEARFYPAGSVEHGSYVYDEADDKKAYLLADVPKRYFSEIVLQLTKATASGKERNENWKMEEKRG